MMHVAEDKTCWNDSWLNVGIIRCQICVANPNLNPK